MPLQTFFARKKQEIDAFLEQEGMALLYIGLDPEAEVLLIKLLSAIDAHPHNRDVFFGFDHPFDEPETWYPAALRRMSDLCDAMRPALELEGISCTLPPLSRREREPIESAFARSVSALAGPIEARCDHLVLVFGGLENARKPAFIHSLERLLVPLTGTTLKVIVVGPRETSIRKALPHRKDIVELEFHVSPQAIEQGIQEKLAGDRCPPLERMRHLTMLAGFAMARKEFPMALRYGQEVLEHFHREGNAAEEASAAFNLGNTCYRQEDWTSSRGWYERCLDLALEQKMHSLSVQALINLGNTWFKVDQLEHALAHYQGALRWSRAIQDPFATAQALELMGLVFQKQERPAEAAARWLEALAIYRDLEPALHQPARAGEAQLLERLATLPASARADAVHPGARPA